MLRSKTSSTTTKPAEQKSLPHQYTTNHFKFCKEYNASGIGIINSQSDYYYKVSRPDSIRFSQGSELEILLDKFHLYRLPMDYSSESGQYEIHAKHAVAFLNALITLKNKEGDKVIYGKTEFEKLLKDLKDNNYLSTTEVDCFKNLIPTELTLEEREELAELNRDFKEALALAMLYKNNLHETSNWRFAHAYYWLKTAFTFKPSNIKLEDEINLNEFFSAFTSLSTPKFFTEQNQILLKILKENTTIKNIIFSRDDSDIRYVNQYLADFIAESKTIESIDINTGFWQRDRLNDVHMDYIAYGLRFNISLKELSLAGHPIKDDGLIILLESLKANPNSKLYKLNLAETSLTDVGAKALIEFLKQNKTLTWINLNLNSNISKELIAEIDKLTENNKAHGQTNTTITIIPNNTKLKKALLPTLGKRLNVGECLRSNNNTNWLQTFENSMNGHAHASFVINNFSSYDSVDFIIGLKHINELNMHAKYAEGMYCTRDGTILKPGEVDFSVQSERLSKDSSVLNIRINKLRVNNLAQLDNKLAESFATIKTTFQKMFTHGIYCEGYRASNSWLGQEDQLISEMVSLGTRRGATSYSYRKQDFPSKLTEEDKLVIEYDKHRKTIAMIEPQNARRYQERNGSTKNQDILYHQACIHEIQEKLGIDRKIKEHKKAIAMIEPQNARRFAERNCLFTSKDQALAYYRICLRELGEPVQGDSPKLK